MSYAPASPALAIAAPVPTQARMHLSIAAMMLFSFLIVHGNHWLMQQNLGCRGSYHTMLRFMQ